MKYQDKLAKMIRDRENKEVLEPCLGTVVSPPPALKVSIWNGEVVLKPNQLYMNDRLFGDHKRKYSLDGDVEEQTMDVTSSDMTEAGQGPHKHTLIKWGGSGTYKAKGTITNTDTLVKGDLVKVTPAEDGQIWFVDFKVRKLG